MPYSAQHVSDGPLLVIDKKGLLAPRIAELLAPKKMLLVSRLIVQKANVYEVPYNRVIPKLPLLPYTGIIVIYDGTEDLFSLLPDLSQKARLDMIPLFIVLPFQFAKEAVVAKLAKKAPDGQIVILGQVFGKVATWHTEATMNAIFAVAASKKRLVLRNWGMKNIYPVFVDTAITTLISLVMNPPREKTLLLLPKNGMSELSFAHLLQKADPDIKVDFTKESGTKEQISLPRGKYVLTTDYEGMEHVKDVLALAQKEFKREIPTTKHMAKETKQRKKHSFFPVVILSIGTLFLLLLLPVLVLGATGLFGAYELNSARAQLEQGNLSKGAAAVKMSNFFFSVAKQASLVFAAEAGFVDAEEKVEPLINQVSAGQDGALIFSHLLSAYQLFSHHPGQVGFVSGLNEAKAAFDVLQDLQTNPSLPKGLMAKLQQVAPAIGFIKNTGDVLPTIAGFEKPKTYLVLFQNNMELRPTGGFIGSYGLLTLKNGTVINFSIHDVYQADGQLKQHVEPPFPVRRYLPSAHLYLRDSNFSVNFPYSASVSATLLYDETKQKVDGVIGVDLTFIKLLLQATGPLYLPDYKQTVTSDNFFLLTEEHTEKNFFPGSTQKKDFLQALFLILQNKLFVSHKLNYEALAEGLGQALMQKDLLFAFADPSVQNLFTINGYSDAIWDDRQTGANIQNNYLGENEANLGVNKANYFIKRSINIQEAIGTTGAVNGQYSIKLTNTSTTWPGGDYKAYLRFLLPAGSVVTKVTIDQVPQQIVPAVVDPLTYEAKIFTPPKGLEVWQDSVAGKTTEGFLSTVPAGKTQTVTLFYTLPFTIDLTSPEFTYNLRLIKQPGTEADPYAYTIAYPASYSVLTTQGKTVSKTPVTVTTVDQLASDTDYQFVFTKK